VAPIFIDAVSRAVAAAVERADAPGQTLELAGPQMLTTDEILRTLQKVLGRRRPLLHQPVGLVKLMTWPMQFLPAPILTPAAIEFILQEVESDPRLAMQYLGFDFLPLEDGLRRYL
jgi:NADH dehydrogenase